MSFAPFDTSLIVERLRSAVPDLHRIGGAADYGAVEKLSGFRTPSAYVIFAEEDNTGRVPTSPGVCAQESAVQFGVVLALRHYAEQRGEQMQDEARRLIAQVRTALIGHRPQPKGATAIGWQSGKVLDYSASVLLFADVYRLTHTMHRDEVAPCPPRA